MFEIKGTATEMQNNVDGLIGRWDMAEGRISEFEDISIETLKTEKQGEQRLKEEKQKTIPKACRTTTKYVTYA